MESGEKVSDHKELEFSCAQNRNKENGIGLLLGVNRVRITDKREALDPNFVFSLTVLKFCGGDSMLLPQQILIILFRYNKSLIC